MRLASVPNGGRRRPAVKLPRSADLVHNPRHGGEDSHIAIAPPAAPERQAFPLTDEQQAIVEHGDGPLVVIAGAGTGKTRIIVERVRHLLATKQDLLPEQLL